MVRDRWDVEADIEEWEMVKRYAEEEIDASGNASDDERDSLRSYAGDELDAANSNLEKLAAELAALDPAPTAPHE